MSAHEKGCLSEVYPHECNCKAQQRGARTVTARMEEARKAVERLDANGYSSQAIALLAEVEEWETRLAEADAGWREELDKRVLAEAGWATEIDKRADAVAEADRLRVKWERESELHEDAVSKKAAAEAEVKRLKEIVSACR